ncbi:MAG: FAD-dependent oxidoreductase [Phycisphaeraceae bacterium]
MRQHSSYRVRGNAVALGEAAGVTAALVVRHGKLPHEVPNAAIVDHLAAPA